MQLCSSVESGCSFVQDQVWVPFIVVKLLLLCARGGQQRPAQGSRRCYVQGRARRSMHSRDTRSRRPPQPAPQVQLPPLAACALHPCTALARGVAGRMGGGEGWRSSGTRATCTCMASRRGRRLPIAPAAAQCIVCLVLLPIPLSFLPAAPSVRALSGRRQPKARAPAPRPSCRLRHTSEASGALSACFLAAYPVSEGLCRIRAQSGMLSL